MEKRRSIAVFILGLYFIILSFVGLFQLINHFQQYVHFGIVYLVFAAICIIALFFCGIFILALKPIARKVAIILCLLNILFGVIVYDSMLPDLINYLISLCPHI